MRKYSTHSIGQWLAVAAIFFLFCYFRVKPIYFQTVPYTYDQGRDFLKAEEIVRYVNPTFIGPTTGIQGLHHGAWWFYFLSIVFTVFNGWPQGFYYGILFLTFLSAFFFFLFLKRHFRFSTALLFLLIVTVSPYFIRISFFPGNNILTPSAVLLLMASVYMFFKTGKAKYIFLIGLALGFINETEVSFGIFLIPPFIILSLFFKDFRDALKNKKFLLLFVLGILIPFLPRILFNIKNHFIEITSTLHFLKTTPPTNPQSFVGAAQGRVQLFIKYYQDIIYDHNDTIGTALFVVTLCSLTLGFKTMRPHVRKTLIFFFCLLIGVFVFSLLNKNNFFWDNYLEGIHYIYLFLILLGFEALWNIKYYSRAAYIISALFVFINVMLLVRSIRSDTLPIPPIGLRADVMTVNYIYRQVGRNDFCVRIYTPPIVPYTYNYLFSYYSKVLKYKQPTDQFKDNQCWFIIDKETFTERLTEWRNKNTPEKAKLLKRHTMPNGATLELWTQT